VLVTFIAGPCVENHEYDDLHVVDLPTSLHTHPDCGASGVADKLTLGVCMQVGTLAI